MRPVDKQLVLRSGVEAAESGCRGSAGILDVLPLGTDREIPFGGDEHRQIGTDVELARAVALGRVEGDGRQGHLVGDEWVVGQDRGRKKAVAGKTVRHRLGTRQQRRYGRGDKAAAK